MLKCSLSSYIQPGTCGCCLVTNMHSKFYNIHIKLTTDTLNQCFQTLETHQQYIFWMPPLSEPFLSGFRVASTVLMI